MSELTEKLVRYVRSIPFADNEAGHPEIAQAMREAAATIAHLETENTGLREWKSDQQRFLLRCSVYLVNAGTTEDGMEEGVAEITAKNAELQAELAEAKDTIRAFEEVHIPLLKHEIDILKGEHQTWSSGGTDEAAGLRLNAVDEPSSGECNSTAISGPRR